MPAAPVTHRRPARLGVLLAAVLHLLGAAGGVWVHAHPVRVSDVAALASDDGGERGAPRPHNELTCVVCQLFGAHAVPGAAVVLHAPTEVAVPATVPGEALHAVGSPLTARPRAPPFA